MIIKSLEPVNESLVVSVDADGKVLKKGVSFYNAQGTTGDKVRYGKSFDITIEAWEKLTGKIRYNFGCCNENCSSNKNSMAYLDIITGKNPLVGAHIVLEEPTCDVQDGDECFIVPLCNCCNLQGSKVEMKFKQDTPYIKVKIVDA